MRQIVRAVCLLFCAGLFWPHAAAVTPLGWEVALAGPALAADHGGDDGGGDDGGGDDGGGDDGGGGGPQAGGDDRDGPPARTKKKPKRLKSPAARTAPPVADLPVQAADEIVVMGLSAPDLDALLAEGFAVIEATPLKRNGPVLYRLQVPDGVSVTLARDRVRALPTGGNADFNHYYRTSETVVPASAPAGDTASDTAPCDHLNCAFLRQITWPALGACPAPVRIGMIDTGINLDHPGLAKARIEVIALADPDHSASTETHGTAVAALLVGAEPRAPGLLPNAQMVAVDIFSRAGGDERADVMHLVQALNLLTARGLPLVNLSLAGPENTVLRDMLAAADAAGTVIVAAVGNAGPTAPPAWPAAASTALAVTAVDGSDRIYRRAQRGAHVDLAAPGVEVWSAATSRGVKPRTGTSFATPFVTAAAAVLMDNDPDLTPAAVRGRLVSMTRDLGAAGPDEVFGAGILNLAALCED